MMASRLKSHWQECYFRYIQAEARFPLQLYRPTISNACARSPYPTSAHACGMEWWQSNVVWNYGWETVSLYILYPRYPFNLLLSKLPKFMQHILIYYPQIFHKKYLRLFYYHNLFTYSRA